MKIGIALAESSLFQNFAEKHLSDEERLELVSFLSVSPLAGKLIKGTGGLRKLRWAYEGSGKSGGYRVIYYYYNSSIPIFLLYAFRKGEMENISDEAKSKLAELARQYRHYYLSK